jgi:hypothetical protein
MTRKVAQTMTIEAIIVVFSSSLIGRPVALTANEKHHSIAPDKSCTTAVIGRGRRKKTKTICPTHLLRARMFFLLTAGVDLKATTLRATSAKNNPPCMTPTDAAHHLTN